MPEVGEGDMAVYFGKFAAALLPEFLGGWQLPQPQMPWALWLWTDNIVLEHQKGIPNDLDYLERGHIFGEAGELTLRRAGDDVRWTFVGTAILPEEIIAHDAPFNAQNYWTSNVNLRLRPYERTALLWGEYMPQIGQWYQARVGRAELAYPTLAGHTRVQIHYREYLYAGDVALVWHWGIDSAADNEEEKYGNRES